VTQRQVITDEHPEDFLQLELGFPELGNGISHVTPPPTGDLTLPGRDKNKKVVVSHEQRVQMLMRLIEPDRYW
jgi:hypothetical protein